MNECEVVLVKKTSKRTASINNRLLISPNPLIYALRNYCIPDSITQEFLFF